MSLVAINCESCGGSVAMRAGERVPKCLFCGSTTLLVEEPPEGVEPPETYVPFVLSESDAQAAFRVWSLKRFWAPSAIRQARLELNDLLLPAWLWSGTVESHWSALVSAGTRSGKRPHSGSETLRVQGLLVLASQTLRRAELADISPFDASTNQPFDTGEATLPYELGSLTRRAATAAAQADMRASHKAQIRGEIGALRLSTSCLYSDLQGRPLLLPVWIGAYRVGEQMYRVVLNGQSGALTGTSPVSWVKLVIAIGAVVALLVLLWFLGANI